MQMTDYLKEIEFASIKFLETIWGEREQLTQLESQIALLAKVVESNYQRAESWTLNAEDPDDVAMAAGISWDNYFNEDKDLYHKDQKREKLADQVAAHEFSIGVASGALLQNAKQGISIVHGGLANCPNGRMIGSQSLKTVIWQGRNQAIHWEEGSFKPPVKQCFKLLEQEINAKFADFTKRSMAFDVVDLLGWKTYQHDLLTLA
jgi:hypothetical protein